MKYPGWEEDAKKKAEYMKNCKGCNIPKCPVLNRDQCPIKRIFDLATDKKETVKEVEEYIAGRVR